MQPSTMDLPRARYPAGAELHRAPPRDAFGTYLQLRTVTRRLEAILEARLADHGLTIAEFCGLRLLVDSGPQSLSLVGQWVSISNSGATKLVDRLESKNLVRRTRDMDDRRIIRVEPTQEGQALLGDVFPGHMDKILALLGCLNPDEIGELHDLLTTLRACVESAAGGEPVES